MLKRPLSKLLTAGVIASSLFAASSSYAWPYGYWGPGWGYGFPPGYFHNGKHWRVGKVDLDGDLNYDRVVSNDASDGGRLESSPPGLIVGSGEMTKLVLRVSPNSVTDESRLSNREVNINFDKLVVSLDVRGINLGDKKGRFASFDEEVSKSGRIKVWSDERRSQLLLDSADMNKRRIEWPMSLADAPYSVYVEGVTPAVPGAVNMVTLELDDSNRKGFFQKLWNEAAAWDSLLISCRSQGVPKHVAEPAVPVVIIAGYSNYGGFAANERDSRKVWVPAVSGNK